MDRIFVTVGKVALVVVFVGALAGIGYYLGRSGKIHFGVIPEPTAISTANPTEIPTPTTDETPLTPTPTVSFK
jgi:hypothetical protein